MIRGVSMLCAMAIVFTAVALAQPPSKGKAKAKAISESYEPHADSKPKDGVPKGKLIKMPEWKSEVFAGTVRDWSVYVPAQYKADGPPACVMVFQDGSGYSGGPVNVPTVFDNLIHAGEMPVTVAVFVNPGDKPKDGIRNPRPSNRSIEYDTLSGDYAKFLLDEILPAAETQAGVKLKTDPASRAIGGRSSGGICAWTVAWERPDQFGKVWSAIGSFTNIRGGDRYPGIIRKTPKKDIRICFQDGENDLDNDHGNWWLGNLQMEKALAYKGYDYKFIRGVGAHSNKQEAAVLPDALRWLWRDHAK